MIGLTDLHTLVDDLTELVARANRGDRQAAEEAVKTCDLVIGEAYNIRGLLVRSLAGDSR